MNIDHDLFEGFELSESEKLHPIWLRLKAHLTNKLDILRRRNDGALDPIPTAELRGHIRCLKATIALGDDRPLTGDE